MLVRSCGPRCARPGLAGLGASKAVERISVRAAMANHTQRSDRPESPRSRRLSEGLVRGRTLLAAGLAAAMAITGCTNDGDTNDGDTAKATVIGTGDAYSATITRTQGGVPTSPGRRWMTSPSGRATPLVRITRAAWPIRC